MKKLTKIGQLVLLLLLVLPLNGCNGEYFGPGVSDYNYDLSGGYYFMQNGAREPAYICDPYTHPIIENYINGIAWDDQFIIASQKDDNATSYWIIDVKAKNLIGPLNKNEFDEKRSILHVDSQLILRDPAKYKFLDPSNKYNQ